MNYLTFWLKGEALSGRKSRVVFGKRLISCTDSAVVEA